MDPQRLVKLSKSMSKALRHDPGRVGLNLDEGGWTPVDDLVRALRTTREEVERVVRESDKQRFALSPDGARIRANQGHSVPVDLGLAPEVPPDVLYHGTHPGAVEAILANGLERMARHAAHLSPDVETAVRVGARRGRPVVLRIDAARMAADGHLFIRSENGVWLVERVPAEYVIRNDQ